MLTMQILSHFFKSLSFTLEYTFIWDINHFYHKKAISICNNL